MMSQSIEDLSARLRDLDFIGCGKTLKGFGQGSEEICFVF